MYFCPRCKAEVPIEALYCHRCGFNATNARLKSLSGISNELRAPDRPGVPDTPQTRVQAIHTSPLHPNMPEATRTIQPQSKRVMSPRNSIAPPTPPIPPAAIASSFMPNNADAGLRMSATPPVVAAPAPIAPPTGHTNPSIPSRPVPSSTYTRQSSQKQITPAHLLSLQPSIPSTPPALPTSSVQMPPSTSQFQQAHQFSPVQRQLNVSQPPPAQPVGQQGQMGQPQR